MPVVDWNRRELFVGPFSTKIKFYRAQALNKVDTQIKTIYLFCYLVALIVFFSIQ